MNGSYLAKLMDNKWLKEALAKHARRYSKQLENQEEYIQDAWLRIAEHEEGESLEYYAERGRMAINASRERQRYHRVQKKKVHNLHGISATAGEKPPPKRAINVYRNKYLDPKHETLDWQYYEGQEEELIEKAKEDIEWYNQYEGFDQLTEHEKNEVIYGFIRSGFWVGLPKNGTRGKNTRFYEMYYTVDRDGVVEKTKPFEGKTELIKATPGGGAKKMDLRHWYKLRDFGGSEEWMKKLNKIIFELEQYIESSRV